MIDLLDHALGGLYIYLFLVKEQVSGQYIMIIFSLHHGTKLGERECCTETQQEQKSTEGKW